MKRITFACNLCGDLLAQTEDGLIGGIGLMQNDANATFRRFTFTHCPDTYAHLCTRCLDALRCLLLTPREPAE